MFKKLIGAAAVAAIAYAAVPAYAAKALDCSGENLEKTESAAEAMADGAAKTTVYKEITQAQEALLDGKIGACAMHLSKAMHAGGVNQAAYSSVMNQAPGGTTTAPSQWGWKPVKPAI
jgi:hypothetical protein